MCCACLLHCRIAIGGQWLEDFSQSREIQRQGIRVYRVSRLRYRAIMPRDNWSHGIGSSLPHWKDKRTKSSTREQASTCSHARSSHQQCQVRRHANHKWHSAQPVRPRIGGEQRYVTFNIQLAFNWQKHVGWEWVPSLSLGSTNRHVRKTQSVFAVTYIYLPFSCVINNAASLQEGMA